jgi:hypothetical protein
LVDNPAHGGRLNAILAVVILGHGL